VIIASFNLNGADKCSGLPVSEKIDIAMEFFQIVDVGTTEEAIQKKLTLGNLEAFCESIFPLEENPEVCLTGGMWV